MNNPTSEQVKIGFKVLAAMGKAIQDLGEIPNGHLYTQMMQFVNLDQYTKLLNILKNNRLVTEDATHMLRWIGPKTTA